VEVVERGRIGVKGEPHNALEGLQSGVGGKRIFALAH